MYVFERSAPTSLAFAVLEPNKISLVVFICVRSIQIERYTNAMWKGSGRVSLQSVFPGYLLRRQVS